MLWKKNKIDDERGKRNDKGREKIWQKSTQQEKDVLATEVVAAGVVVVGARVVLVVGRIEEARTREKALRRFLEKKWDE